MCLWERRWALICLERRKISNKVRSTIITFFLVLFLHKKQELIQNYADQRIVLQKCYTCKSRVNYCVNDITLNIFLSHFIAWNNIHVGKYYNNGRVRNLFFTLGAFHLWHKSTRHFVFVIYWTPRKIERCLCRLVSCSNGKHLLSKNPEKKLRRWKLSNIEWYFPSLAKRF